MGWARALLLSRELAEVFIKPPAKTLSANQPRELARQSGIPYVVPLVLARQPVCRLGRAERSKLLTAESKARV